MMRRHGGHDYYGCTSPHSTLPKNIVLLARNPLLPCFKLRLAQPLQWYCDAVGGALRIGPCSREELLWADVVILQREPTPAMLQTVKEARELGINVVYDMDDLLTGLPDFLAFPFADKNAPEVIRTLAAGADVTTCSTARLEREMAKVADVTAVVPNAMAAPAPIEVEEKQTDGPCTFVLAASDTVQSGWLRYPLTRLLRKHPESRLVIVGRVGKDWQDKNIPADYYPLLSPEAFSGLLLSLRNAVGVIPLDDSLFSACKSAIKFYHYSLCGVVTVASKVPPYTDEMTHGETGLLLENDPQEWLAALEELAGATDKRKLLLAKALRWCHKNAGPTRAVEAWKKAFHLLPRPGGELRETTAKGSQK